MQPLARGYSFVMYLAEGGATYTVPFPYLHLEDLRVFAGDVGDAVEQQVKWLSPTEFQITSTIPEKILVTLRRFTRRDDLLAVYHDGGQLPAKDMNTNAKQLLFIMQEQLDFGTYGGGGLPGGGSGWPMPDGSTPSLPIQQIIDGLMQSPIFQLLIGTIDSSDQTAETILQEVLRSDEVYEYRRLSEKKFGDAEAEIAFVTQTIANEVEARATAILKVYARFDETDATILDVRQAVASETEARTTAITDLRAEALGTTAHVEERLEALVKGNPDPNGNPLWSANWSIRINGTSLNGQPVVAGVGLGVDSKNGSNFIVMADRFAIVKPTYTGSDGVDLMRFPFVVGTVGGVDTVGITGQLIVDGSVTADKLRVNSLAAITANMGTVNGGIFRTYSLDAYGNIIDPLEFRVELTNNPNDPWPFWIGSGVKNANNAVVWFDRSGNASFNGTIRAQNMVEQLQQYVTAAWTGSIQASNSGASSSFTLPPPVRLGESHVPMLQLSLLLHNPHADEFGSAIVSVERLSSSTWVTVKSYTSGLNHGESRYDSLFFTDIPTTKQETYRVAIGPTGSRSDNIFFEGLDGSAFGLR